MTRVSRRSFFRRTVAAGAVGAGLTTQAWAQSLQPAPSKAPLADIELPPLPFLHGVASGDPLPDGVILWTRVTPEEDALPGSGLGAPTRLRWEVALDTAFTQVEHAGEVTSDPEHDHCVHVDVRGLEPDTVYYYRFIVADGPHAGVVGPVGRTGASPSKHAHVEQAKWAVASCANFEAGFFSAYADMAARAWRGELDLCVFLGDYLYEYPSCDHAGRGPVRLTAPAHEIVTLADYRTRYGRYRTDPALKDAHGAMPWIVVWDDHEVANNTWREGAANHNPGEGEFIARRDAAQQAYYEWMPVRRAELSGEGRIYRSFTFGDLVELTIMDLRTYRDVEFWRGGSREPGDARTMLGSEQYDWLLSTLTRSSATWNALGNSVMFSPMHLGVVMQHAATRPVASALSSNILASATTGAPLYNEMPLNGDQWDGYDFERRRLLNALGRMGKNPVFLTGDIHSEWAHTVTFEGEEIGCEIVCSSITAPNVSEALDMKTGHPVLRTAAQYMLAANPSLEHCALDTHGYTTVTLTHDEVVAEWLRVENILAPQSPVTPGVSLTWRKGEGFVR